MTKKEYMEQLKAKLKRLPKEDFERAIEYYEEYFAEAGEENEKKAIEDLGSPQEAADQIICDMAITYSEEPVQNVKKGMHALWVSILAICAAPIALPLMLAGFVLVVAAYIVVFTLIVAFLITAVSCVIMGPVAIVSGLMVITKSIPVFFTCVGMGLIMVGFGAAVAYGLYLLCKKFIAWTLRAFGKIVQKRGKSYEK